MHGHPCVRADSGWLWRQGCCTTVTVTQPQRGMWASKGITPQETRQKPSPTPFLTEGTLSTESTSYPGCFQFVRLGFCTQDCSTWEITAGETWSAEKHHTNQTNKVPGARRKEINPRLDSWHRNGGSWVLQPVCGLATQTPNHSAYFCCVQVQWVCISGPHTPHNDPSIKLNCLRRANKPFQQTHYRASLRVMASSLTRLAQGGLKSPTKIPVPFDPEQAH